MAWTLMIWGVCIIVKKGHITIKKRIMNLILGFPRAAICRRQVGTLVWYLFVFLAPPYRKLNYMRPEYAASNIDVCVWYVRDSGLIIFQYWLILFFFLLLHVPTLSIYSSFGGHSQITVLGERVEKAPRTEFVVEPLVVIVRCAIYFIMQNSKY